MTYQEQINLEVIKTALTIAVAVFTLGVGWIIGNRLSARISVAWAIRQKQREIELETAKSFYAAYGEFFAVWKLWGYHKEKHGPDASRWDLLQRASTSEGAMEAIFVKLASERWLTKREVEILGRFRQAYQTLREAIRDDRSMGWSSDKYADYVSFKRLAGLVSAIILSSTPRRSPIADPEDALMQVTSNTWEHQWALSDADWTRLKKT